MDALLLEHVRALRIARNCFACSSGFSNALEHFCKHIAMPLVRV